MAYKTIAALITDAESADRVTRGAVAIAAKFGAHLIGVYPEQVAIPEAAMAGVPGMEPIIIDPQVVKESESAARARFEAAANLAEVVTEWRAIPHGSSDAALPALSSMMCADLVVVGQREPRAKASSVYANLETVMFDSGRPVLAVPFAGTPDREIRKVLLAWNATRESARAAFDALPFMLMAEETEILMVDPDADTADEEKVAGAEIAAALSRHGINVKVNAVRSAGLAPAAVIENRVFDTGSDLLVMGAYSHSRLREWLFGGVTRTLLESMTSLTLLSR